ncbi:MAG: hypothetical protein JXM71_05915, partial [Spirochaetales bacterium]|nr:hypothetical protein [Spirochaetales bacterium]
MGTDELSRWRDALIVDKDDALIAAAKRWLGPVKTPFNKHELVARVESFLKRHDTTTAIIELLDRPDRRIVALSLFSGTIASGELVRLAAGDDISEAAALRRIHSLKERLVLYSFQDSTGVERYAVSPPLYEALQAALTPADALSVAIGTEEPAGLDPFASFCALVSAGTHAKPAFKGKLEPGKRAQAILDANAPGLAADKSRLEAMLGALIANGVAGYGADGRPVLYPQRFVELCDETGDTAPLILLSSCAANRAGGERVTPALMRAALEAMPRALAVSEHDVRRVVALATGNDLALPATVEAIAWTLIALGFFVRGDDSLYRASSAVDTALETPPDAAPGTAGRSIVVEESHEIRILPEAGYAARAFVSAIARLEGSGLVWSATLDKSAAKAAFAYGFRAADIAARLESLAGLPLPQSVRFSLDAWESESRSARVRVGVVVALDGHLSGVLEHSPRAANLVHERLAEGVYMLAARDALDAERLLKAAGIDVDIRLPPSDDAAIHRALWREHLASARLRIPIRRLDY